MRLAVFLLLGMAGLSAAQSTPSTSAPRKLIPSLDGKALYNAYCASCHGIAGKGDGPVAAALKQPPPDLSTIRARRKGQFPVAELEKMIAGDSPLPAAHGSRDMPIWGPVFGRVQRDRDLGPVRIRNLVQHLESLQQP